MKFWLYTWITCWFAFAACTTGFDQDVEAIDEQYVKKEEAFNVVLFYSDSATVVVKVTSSKLVRHLDSKEPRDEFPEGLKVEFFNANGQVRAWLKADRAVRYEQDNQIIVNENVELYNSKGERLETSQLIWDENKQILHTDRYVTITRPGEGERTSGFGIEVDKEFNRLEIKQKLSGTFKVSDPTKE